MALNKSRALEEAARLVSQRKLPEAVKRYLAITEKDPEDLSLLNTTGDLCVRIGNVPEALRQFNKLAAAYTREGFTLKAIAIYKKIAKLDVKSADPLLKLAELYASQGLSHEAREQYAQALAICQAHRLQEKTLQILTQLVAYDPSNAAHRMRLAELHETAGRRDEALDGYLEAAELACRYKNAALAQTAIAKATQIDAGNVKLLLFEIRRAAENGRFEEVQRIYLSAPEMRANSDARLMFLSALLAAEKLNEALNLAVEAYRDGPAGPDGFEPLERFVKHCLEAGNADAVIEVLQAVAELALERDQERLVKTLQQVAVKRQNHTSSLEWMENICMRAESVRGWAEALEAIANAYAVADEWENAARIYGKLIEADQQHPHWRSLLDQALRKQREKKPVVPGPMQPVPETGPLDLLRAAAPAEFVGPAAGLPASPGPTPVVEMDFFREWQGFTSGHADSPPHAENLGEEKSEAELEDGPEAHYHLGTALREMGLVDEAIGELQKAVKEAGKENSAAYLLDACSLLGACFMEKGEPRIAVKWYLRALEDRDADEETRTALTYDLAGAYEQSGDPKAALETFSEVYRLNIEYREVAEKIRALREQPPGR